MFGKYQFAVGHHGMARSGRAGREPRHRCENRQAHVDERGFSNHRIAIAVGNHALDRQQAQQRPTAEPALTGISLCGCQDPALTMSGPKLGAVRHMLCSIQLPKVN